MLEAETEVEHLRLDLCAAMLYKCPQRVLLQRGVSAGVVAMGDFNYELLSGDQEAHRAFYKTLSRLCHIMCGEDRWLFPQCGSTTDLIEAMRRVNKELGGIQVGEIRCGTAGTRRRFANSSREEETFSIHQHFRARDLYSW